MQLVSLDDTLAIPTGVGADDPHFKNEMTEAVFNGLCPKGFPTDIFRTARRKLEAVNAANRLDDLRVPPANRLEALKAERKGQHSIRVNRQWRVCFVWTDQGPTDVEIVDDHE